MKARVGVLLLYMGCASRLSDIKPFLFSLFSDPVIVPLPSPLRIPVAWLTSRIRYPMIKKAYERIGGGSPLLSFTFQQAEALRKSLQEAGIEAVVSVGMRYTPPSIEHTLFSLIKDGIQKVVALTLYPQYSTATAGTCISVLERAIIQFPGIDVYIIPHWHTHPLFITCWATLISDSIQEMHPEKGHILFSAHSLPVRLVKQGDPYPTQIKECTEAIMTKLKKDIPHSIAYQSKVGAVKWLEPKVEEEMKRLAAKGVKELILVPISFVSDHLETLYELDIVMKHLASRLGFETFRRVPVPNLHPLLIKAWTDMALEKIK